jgi:DNA modification methylase
MGRADYHYRHESIFYGWTPGAAHQPPADRKQDSVWEVDKPRANKVHPTMKPVELITRAIQNSSRVGEIVLDSFGGSGSTLIAAEQTKRKARLIELDPKYCDVIVQRWEALTGLKAELVNAGR